MCLNKIVIILHDGLNCLKPNIAKQRAKTMLFMCYRIHVRVVWRVEVRVRMRFCAHE